MNMEIAINGNKSIKCNCNRKKSNNCNIIVTKMCNRNAQLLQSSNNSIVVHQCRSEMRPMFQIQNKCDGNKYSLLPICYSSIVSQLLTLVVVHISQDVMLIQVHGQKLPLTEKQW